MTIRFARDEDWRIDAACANSSVDFTEIHREKLPHGRGYDPRYLTAASMCAFDCTVQRECLIFALLHVDVDGVAGGMSERQRRAWRRDHGVTVEKFASTA